MGFNFKLIGYPIKHSMSPWIHNTFLKKSGVAGNYTLFEIKPDDNFEEKLEQLKEDNTDGFNITVPYKEKILPYLDEIDETAKEMQAVNTVICKEGKWIGYNTDGMGYVRALKNAYPHLFDNENKSVLMIGSGGAARAIYYALSTLNFTTIDIANRTRSKAEDIASLGNERVNTTVYSMKETEDLLPDYDLIIQTTSVGMKPNEEQSPLEINELKKDAVVSDIIYQPIKSNLLHQAEEAGASIHFGHTMLLHQALQAFEIWTGESIDLVGMDKELQQILEGR